MAHNEILAARIRQLLAGRNDVEEKKMFRGITFMVSGKMCISVAADEIMCRIDPATHDELVETSGCTTMIMKGKEYKGYVLVNEAVLHTKKELAYWVEQALAFNERAKASPKKSTARKK